MYNIRDDSRFKFELKVSTLFRFFEHMMPETGIQKRKTGLNEKKNHSPEEKYFVIYIIFSSNIWTSDFALNRSPLL